MGVLHIGTAIFGKVEQVPGLFFVATRFFHVQFLPLFPVNSYVVLCPAKRLKASRAVAAASDPSPGLWDTVDRQHLVTLVGLSRYYYGIPIGLVGRSVLFGYARFAFLATAVAAAIKAVTLIVKALRGRPEEPPGTLALLVGGLVLGALVLLGLLRSSYRWTYATPDRALELADTAGLPPEVVSDHLARQEGNLLPGAGKDLEPDSQKHSRRVVSHHH